MVKERGSPRPGKMATRQRNDCCDAPLPLTTLRVLVITSLRSKIFLTKMYYKPSRSQERGADVNTPVTEICRSTSSFALLIVPIVQLGSHKVIGRSPNFSVYLELLLKAESDWRETRSIMM
jgi:hypothetical protein